MQYLGKVIGVAVALLMGGGFWGVVLGFGTGMTAMVLGATVATRWFTHRRGLVMGLLAASLATGQLVFLPLLAPAVTGDERLQIGDLRAHVVQLVGEFDQDDATVAYRRHDHLANIDGLLVLGGNRHSRFPVGIGSV